MGSAFKKINKTYSLNDAAIDEISFNVQNQLTELNYDKKNIHRIRLLIEDVLLDWKDKFGDRKLCTFIIGKRFRKPFILLESAGESFNPLEKDNETFGEWGQHLLDGLGFHPMYSYTTGKNTIRFDLKAQKAGSLMMIMIAILTATVLGMLGSLIPSQLKEVIMTQVLDRLSNAFYGMLGAVSGPLVFLSVLTGICNIGDTATLGKMGKKVVSHFVLVSFFAALFSGLIFPFIFEVQFGTGSGISGVSDMADMLFGMIPGNLLSPFLDGNCLQIIVLAVTFGIALLILDKSANNIVVIAEQLNSTIRLIMNWIVLLIPYLIFILLLQNIWSGSFAVLLHAWKPFVLSIVLSVLAFCLSLMFSSIRWKVPVSVLLKNIFPAMLIALTTASSMAALGECFSNCENNYHVHKKLTNFALPISTIICMPAHMISFTACILYTMQMYQLKLSLASLVLMIVSTTLLLISAPPVSGGILSCYAVVFAQLEIPTEAMAVVLTLSVILDFTDSSINAGFRQLAVISQSKRLNMTD